MTPGVIKRKIIAVIDPGTQVIIQVNIQKMSQYLDWTSHSFLRQVACLPMAQTSALGVHDCLIITWKVKKKIECQVSMILEERVHEKSL